MIDALPLLLLSDDGYQISRSVRLRSSASAYFNRTMAAGSGVTVYTFSTWVKRGELGTIKPIVQGYLNNNNYGHIIFKADNTIEWREFSVAVNYGQVNTNAVFRDPSAWYHIVVVRNGTSLLIYVNGVSQALTVSTAVNAAGGYLFGASTEQRIGRDQVNSAFFDGYLTECYLIDGQNLTPLAFGETNTTTGVWQPKKYAGTYGTNGFYLNFSDNSGATATTIGKDYSGNGNNWTPNNISVTAGVTYDSMLDVPTQWADGGNGRGNYATLNPLHQRSSNTLSAANLQFVLAAISEATVTAGFGLSSGQWYWEVIPTAMTGAAFGAGVVKTSIAAASMSVFATGGVGYYASTGNKYINGTATAYGASYTINDVIGVALDLGANTITFYKNNVSQGVITIDSGAEWIAGCGNGTNTGTQTGNFNFGQRPFTYTPPSGFKALNTLNLPTPTILKGNQYFDATLWTGDGSYPRTIGGLNFQPDLVWLKARSITYDNVLYDSVRGTGTGASLVSNNTAVEGAGAVNINMSGFASNGFTIGATSSTNILNASGQTFVGWQWKEGATQGFDIVTWTGTGAAQNISHNLGVAPSMIIWKYRSAASDWAVGHTRMNNGVNPWNYWAALNSTAAQAASAGAFNNTAPTSSQFTVGSFNANATSMIAYLFAEVAGFSKFGSYTGNGSTDGPFVFCGFRPRFVMLKNASAATNWRIHDTARDAENTSDLTLYPNLSNAEDTGFAIDILSNGFKLRFTDNGSNGNGNTIIFAAFSEHPFKNALAR